MNIIKSYLRLSDINLITFRHETDIFSFRQKIGDVICLYESQ